MKFIVVNILSEYILYIKQDDCTNVQYEIYRYYRSLMYDMMYPGRRVLKSNFEGVKKVYYVGICSRMLSKRRRSKIPCVKCERRPIINDLEEV